MKKMLFTLSLLFSVFMLHAQIVNISGNVANANGAGVPNVQVVISNLLLGSPMPVGWAVTDNNGDYYWVDTIGGFPLGAVSVAGVAITDCNGSILNQTVSITPNTIGATVNFTYCANGGGGGGCALNLSPITMNGNSLVMSANLAGGTAPNTYFWDMGDGTTYSTQAINHAYASAGTYFVSLVGFDNAGCMDSTSFIVTATGSGGNCATSMSYINNPTNPFSVDFSGIAIGGTGPYTYFWDFGDNTISTAQSPNHVYNQNGQYVACLTITDAAGCTSTDCQIVYVGSSSTCSTYVTSTVGGIPLSYIFISANVNNPNINFFWDFGDGTIDSISGGATAHTYAQAGYYYVCVYEIDLLTGCTTSACQLIVTGGGLPCQTYITYNNTFGSLTVDFVGNSTGTGPYTYAWDFGDGNTSTAQSPTHTYAQDGLYTVCVTITDSTGCSSIDCQSIHVSTNPLCTTSMTATASPANPLDYSFASANANNPNIAYFWDFGDGSIDSLNSVTTHTYAQAGYYHVCLYEIDYLTGCVATDCQTIVVGAGSPCQAYITYNNVFGSSIVDFFANSTGTGPFTYAWDFGDGNISNVANPTHTYNTFATGPVMYNVMLTVTDANGCASVAVESVLVFVGNGAGQISGYLWKDTMNFTGADGLVYLIEYDSLSGSLNAIDTVQTQQGYFSFQNVPMGLYLVKGALLPTDADYANYLPTYYIQSLSWANAQYFGPAPFGLPSFIDLQLIAGNNPGGPGFIGGLVVNGAGRPVNDDNVTLIEDIMNMEPMEGVSVLLLDANNNAVTHTVTAADGSYSFSNIAMGVYNVHVEEFGKITFDTELTIDAANLNHTAVHFTVHDNMVTTTGVYDVANVESFQVFPNPVSETANVQIRLSESMDATLTVTNLMGQVMINENTRLNAGDNTFTVEMSNLPAGLYLLSVQSGTDIITYKVQKQ